MFALRDPPPSDEQPMIAATAIAATATVCAADGVYELGAIDNTKFLAEAKKLGKRIK